MYKSINIDEAVEHVKNIVDSNRCAICDKAGGTRMRYACGHTSCEDCVVVAPDCSICLTPPQNYFNEPASDKPFTERAENAVNLLNVFQNEFHVDVYKRQRVSEQLKIEKELFPECIQAPVKYFNKRKSYREISSNKQNRLSQLPGEEISTIWDNKMEQSSENVEKWLNKYLRRPFADLNSNDERLRKVSGAFQKQQNAKENENVPMFRSSRKRSHFKTTSSVVKKQSLLDSHLIPVKNKEYQKKPRIKNNLSVKSENSKYFKTGSKIKVTGNDESGVVMDDEPIIVIDDSQSLKVDKDMKAWLAVQEAENNKQYDSMSIISSKSRAISPKDTVKANNSLLTTKIPFYLKSNLSHNCVYCNKKSHDKYDMPGTNDNKSESNVIGPAKDVSIIVESKDYTTIIKVKRIDHNQNKMKSMNSVEIQTETISPVIYNKEDEDKLDHGTEYIKQTKPSQDLFRDDINTEDINQEITFKNLNKTQNIVIEESDSDVDLDASVSMEVTAEIHRSCEEIDCGILADVDNIEQHTKRARRAARGFTPTSTDSSNKENFNPNRQKKLLSSKKKPTKKGLCPKQNT